MSGANMRREQVWTIRAGGAARAAVIGVVVSWTAGGVFAQVRGSVSLSQVGGNQRSVGGSSSVMNSFRATSYGINSSGSDVAGRGGDVLNSSLAPGGGFSRGRGVGGTGVTPEDSLMDLPGRRNPIRYNQVLSTPITEVSPRSYSVNEKTSSNLSPYANAPVYTGGSASGGGLASPVQDMATSRIEPSRNSVKAASKTSIAFSPADVYLDAVGATSILGAERGKPITSLALNDGSRYSLCMRQGERYFRSGDYVHAFTEFQLASITSDHDPSSLISMAHASFAMSRDSYSLAVSYIRQAVRSFPELAQAPLQPRGFFGRPNDYARNLTLLEDHVREKPADTDAQFLLAYFRWFDGDAGAARVALDKAYTSTSDALLQKDIEMFWGGMLASGKASGTLGVAGSLARSTSQPATSRPAGPVPVVRSQSPVAP